MTKTIYVAGHNGMVGSAIVRVLERANLLDLNIVTTSHQQLDLTNQQAVADYFKAQRIDEVYLAAAKVGGIHANNSYPAEFIHQNLMIQNNVIHSAYASGVNKLLFLGSSCIYPRHANQPITESELLNGPLEPTNEAYAIAKIAGIKQCEAYSRQYKVDYRSVMPTNLYGENDNFHPDNSHVIPAMMRRFHQAKVGDAPEVVIWGTGRPQREFLHVDDMASACLHVMNLPLSDYNEATSSHLSHVNVGSGVDCSIAELAHTIGSVIGYEGKLIFDTSKPDGAPRKLLNVDRLSSMGWQSKIDLREGLTRTYEWFLSNEESLRGVA